ncbi:MAG: low-specificity L-threonine aldolase [Acidimicrobiales bacterium]
MIDLRSDTMTRPTPSMREAMATAEVGDDVFGEDPTVNRLESQAAVLLGKEAGVFVPSGTQSNLVGIMAHCQRGDEYLVGQLAHTYKWEGGGAAVLGSIQPQPVEMNPDGTMDLELLASYIKPQPSLNHFARSKLLALENTHDGQALPLDYVASVQELARNAGLSLHLDGARLCNAAVAQGVTPARIAEGYDTVSICLSKGLGAPVGSVLVGRADLITEARRWRKMVGGGMRQAGVLAAAGLHALDHHIDRLADDHRRAVELEDGLGSIAGVTVTSRATNMVFATIDVASDEVDAFNKVLSDWGVVVRGGPSYRLVTHLDIDDDAIARTIDAFADGMAA